MRFADVTRDAGLSQPATRWGSGAAFIDYDRDGDLDLFVANYLKFDPSSVPDPGKAPNCLWKGIAVNCGPRGLPTDTNLFYRNRGDGTFEDVSTASGIDKVQGRYAMTAVVMDYDGDGWMDIYVACDSTACILYRNNRDGTFTDVALEAGTAYNEDGQSQAGMGVAIADYDGDGYLDIFKTHFADDLPILYRNTGQGYFEDASRAAGFDHTPYVQWGTGLVDLGQRRMGRHLYRRGKRLSGGRKGIRGLPAPQPAPGLPESWEREIPRCEQGGRTSRYKPRSRVAAALSGISTTTATWTS